MHRLLRYRFWLLALAAFMLVAAACASGASGATGSGSPSLRIASPRDGAQVPSPFTITFDSSVPLDDPSTGQHHVHLCFDGADCNVESQYSLVYGNSFQVKGLSPGEHTIDASLRNADHTDAGASAEITVTVEGGGAASGTGPAPSPTGAMSNGGSGGYGY